MRRFPARSIAAGLAIVSLAACGESPLAPREFAGTPTDGTPAEAVAKVGTLVAIAPLTGFGAGGVTAINNKRETAGWNYTSGTAYHAFLRAADGTMVDLGTVGGVGSIALAMNDSSSVVGLSYAANGKYHAFVSRVVGTSRTMTDLGTLSGGDRSAAYGINSSGTVVGFSYTSAGKQHAVRWVPPLYVAEDLGTLTGGTSSFAYAINDSGTVVGFATSATGATRAFKWTSIVTGITDLGTLTAGTTATARAINNAGEIVGWSTTTGGVTHAFKRSAAGVMSDLGTTGGPSYAFDINSTGQVTGWAQPSAGNEQALLWSAGVTTDLGTDSAATQAQAYALNDSGRVVGTSGDRATVWFLNANNAPVASFVSLAHSKVNQTPEDFDASASSDADGDPLTYSWNFGDTGNASNTASGRTASHLYTVKGLYNVSLTVSDWRGATTTLTQSIRIN
jgi:probable HAF family extracellular repeat protein